MFDMRDRIRVPPFVPVLLAVGVGAIAVVGSLALA